MTSTQQEILALLPKLMTRYPDMRFGQLVVNLSNWASGKPESLWDLEDEALLAAAKAHLTRVQGQPVPMTS